VAGGVVRLGDILGPGGVIGGRFAASVTVNGRPVACLPSNYGPHLGCSKKQPKHCFGSISDSPSGVTVEGGVPLTKSGKGICGHGVKTASEDVLIVSGGFGALGSLVGSSLGGLNLGSGFSGFPSAFESLSAPVTNTINQIGSSVSGFNFTSGLGLSGLSSLSQPFSIPVTTTINQVGSAIRGFL
jgi:hypothetical protein